MGRQVQAPILTEFDLGLEKTAAYLRLAKRTKLEAKHSRSPYMLFISWQFKLFQDRKSPAGASQSPQPCSPRSLCADLLAVRVFQATPRARVSFTEIYVYFTAEKLLQGLCLKSNGKIYKEVAVKALCWTGVSEICNLGAKQII